MTKLRQAVSLCGGLGERLRPLTNHCPKPLVEVGGKPFLEYQLEWAFAQGIQEFLILAGRMPEKFLTRYATRAGVRVQPQPPEWDTSRRLVEAAPLLDERFLLLYNDNFAPVSLAWLLESHEAAGRLLTVTHATKHTGEVKEIGYAVVERDPVLFRLQDGPFSEVLKPLRLRGELNVFAPGGLFYHSIGDIERLKLAAAYLKPKKIILLDRDGTLNEKAPHGEYITRWEDFRWLWDNVAGLVELSKQGFDFIILSNQACIGRGVCSELDVTKLNYRVQAELAWQGVRVLDQFICPHDWDGAACSCRKPLPGMFFEASKKHNLRLDHTLYVGDDPRDEIAARRATCRCLLVDNANTVMANVEVIADLYKLWESL